MTDLQKEFNGYVEKYLLLKGQNPLEATPMSNKEYTRWKSILAIVLDSVYQRYAGDFWFHENKPDIIDAISMAVAETMFLGKKFPDEDESRFVCTACMAAPEKMIAVDNVYKPHCIKCGKALIK